MNAFTGRPSSGRAKRIGKSLLEGLDALGTVLSDGPKRARINEIDVEVRNLLQERDHMIAGLTEPGDLRVSENYDPYWRKPEITTSVSIDPFAEGRLTQCKGRSTSSSFHDAHPGCPYVEKVHTAHEFTLRD